MRIRRQGGRVEEGEGRGGEGRGGEGRGVNPLGDKMRERSST